MKNITNALPNIVTPKNKATNWNLESLILNLERFHKIKRQKITDSVFQISAFKFCTWYSLVILKRLISLTINYENYVKFNDLYAPHRMMSKVVEDLIIDYIKAGNYETLKPKFGYVIKATFTIDFETYKEFNKVVSKSKNSRTIDYLMEKYMESRHG